MQDGLHVGLGAWIALRHDGPGGQDGEAFAAFPPLPRPLDLAGIVAPREMADLARAEDFARICGIVPRRGAPAEGAGRPPLWEAHRALLSRMVFAVRPFGPEEEAALGAARAVLYHDGPHGPEMTPLFLLHEELRLVVRELREAAMAEPGPEAAAALAAAEAQWLLVGERLEVEAALATILRLAARSSLPAAQAERLALEPDMLPSGPEGGYGPTAFAPASAAGADGWLAAEARLTEIDEAVDARVADDPAAAGRWRSWRSGRQGALRFSFAVLEPRRPWITPTLYEADDWRLEAGVAPVSAGDGEGGTLPALVELLYLARGAALVPTPDPVPPRRHPEVLSEWRAGLQVDPRVALVQGVVRRSAGTILPNPSVAPVATMRAAPLIAPGGASKGLPAMAIASRTGIVARAGPASVVEPGRALRLTALPVARPLAHSIVPGMLRLTTNGVVERIAPAAVAARIEAARHAGRPPARTVPEPPPPAWLVAVGCRSLPPAPNPNPAYRWS